MRILVLIVLFILSFSLFAQPGSKRISRSEYIELYREDAIREMERNGIPASITLAQGILESGDGNSPLARYANNHFGIKCHSDWTGKTFIQDDDKKNECFRKYKDPYESYRDHSEFLKKNRYAFLFDLKTTDYKGWAHGLKKAGYATNPKYPQLLIKIIEENNLAQYDRKVSRGETTRPKSSTPVKSKTRVIASNKRHAVKLSNNGIKYIELQEGDDLENLAEEFQMGLWQFLKYNDLSKEDKLPLGYKIYLQPKRAKAKEDFHLVEKGQSMWEISQIYGVKLKKLYKKNRMDEGQEPKAGEKLYLKSNKPR